MGPPCQTFAPGLLPASSLQMARGPHTTLGTKGALVGRFPPWAPGCATRSGRPGAGRRAPASAGAEPPPFAPCARGAAERTCRSIARLPRRVRLARARGVSRRRVVGWLGSPVQGPSCRGDLPARTGARVDAGDASEASCAGGRGIPAKPTGPPWASRSLTLRSERPRFHFQGRLGAGPEGRGDRDLAENTPCSKHAAR